MISQEFMKVLEEQRELHIRKNAGYSGLTNPDPWANFRRCEAFGVPAYIGCLIRFSDKYERMLNLIQNAENDQVNEPLRDTLMDMAAYAMIAICLYEEYCEREHSTGVRDSVADQRDTPLDIGGDVQGTVREVGGVEGMGNFTQVHQALWPLDRV